MLPRKLCSLAGTGERERLRGSLFDLRSAWNVQTRGQGNLSLLTSSLAYLAPIVPLNRFKCAKCNRNH